MKDCHFESRGCDQRLWPNLCEGGKLPSELHRQLIDAQAQRTRADYDLNPELSQEDAEMLITQAQAFLEAGQQYLA